jgi:hypothetical protein
MTDRSAGSWSSTTRIPALIACGIPAGHSTLSPAATGTRLVAASKDVTSWLRAHPASSSAPTSRLKPRYTAAPGSASSTIQASVLPCGLARCSAANRRSGCTWTGSRCPASSSLTSRPVSLPHDRLHGTDLTGARHQAAGCHFAVGRFVLCWWRTSPAPRRYHDARASRTPADRPPGGPAAPGQEHDPPRPSRPPADQSGRAGRQPAGAPGRRPPAHADPRHHASPRPHERADVRHPARHPAGPRRRVRGAADLQRRVPLVPEHPGRRLVRRHLPRRGPHRGRPDGARSRHGRTGLPPLRAAGPAPDRRQRVRSAPPGLSFRPPRLRRRLMGCVSLRPRLAGPVGHKPHWAARTQAARVSGCPPTRRARRRPGRPWRARSP